MDPEAEEFSIPEDRDDYYMDTEIPEDYDEGLSLSEGEEDIMMSNRSEYKSAKNESSENITWTDQVRMMHLRRFINQMTENVEEKQYVVEKTRDELKKCRGHVEELERERDETVEGIHLAENISNTSAVNRLRAKYDRLCQEILNEIELEAKISQDVDNAEYELSQAHVEQGKLLLAEDNLQRKEEQLQQDKCDMADIRNKKEQQHADQALRRKRAEQRSRRSAEEAETRRRQQLMRDADKSHEKANQHLQKTMAKIRQREVEEDTRQKEHVERRMNTMLKLKQDISDNRENLRALQARDRARDAREQSREASEVERLLAEGGNPQRELIRQQRMQQFENEKKSFAAKQKEKQVEIAAKILLEEERMRKRQKQQPSLFKTPDKEDDKVVKPHETKPLNILESLYLKDNAGLEPTDTQHLSRSRDALQQDDAEPTTEESGRDVTETPSNCDVMNLADSIESMEESSENLAKPEFEGLWDKHKPYRVPNDNDAGPKLPGATKMEKDMYQDGEAPTLSVMLTQVTDLGQQSHVLQCLQRKFKDEGEAARHLAALRERQKLCTAKLQKRRQDIMATVLKKHRDGIIVKQVAGGKEFKGQPFYSKPDVIHFKDIEVGKVYKKKVTLTNVSYSVNYCKLVGLTEHLKDFIHLNFDPPGQLSAGLTCDLHVTFKPMINEDLSGEVRFMAQTGPFTIPILCTIKRCELRLEKESLNFGTTVIGETLRRTVTLSNNGALATSFDFYKVTGLKQRTATTAETSLGRLSTAASDMGGVSPEVAETLTPAPDKQAAMMQVDQSPTKEVAADQHVEGEKEVSPTPEGVDGTALDDDVEQRSAPESLDDMEDLYSVDGITVGQVSSGEIGPFSVVKLEVVWQPTVPGRMETEFCIAFSDPQSDKLTLTAEGLGVDVPVWVERGAVDLHICTLDRLYQDTVVVNNRATTALRLKFEVCKELQNHLELLPKTGYIQAQSQFSAQLKFLPRKSLFEEGGPFFDQATGVLEAPMLITVAGQTRPVPFTVHAVVTNSDLAFDVTDVDFGHCTRHEAVTERIRLTNHSILPQQFGFMGLPEYVEVQPNDGFGTLLPMETIDLDVIFQPAKARDYNFDLTCRTLMNRNFKIHCRGVGVHPPLELSQQVLHLAATAINDVTVTSLHVINSHTSTNEFTHPVPRIGQGSIAPVGPTSFEFVVPEGAPLAISPCVGTVEPGKRCRVNVRFLPTLDDEAIRQEAVRIKTKALELQVQEEHLRSLNAEKEAQEQALKVTKKPAGKAKGSPTKSSPAKAKNGSSAAVVVKGPSPVEVPRAEDIQADSSDYSAALASLIRQFTGSFRTVTIPCHVASGACANPGELPHSPHNTLYLEVHCPSVRPELVIISDNGHQTADFGEVSLGQAVVKSITVQNISDRPLDLRSSSLDPCGPFQMINALRNLSPDSSHTLLLGFTPGVAHKFQETLGIVGSRGTLHVTLKGRGVNPVTSISVQNGVMDLGAVIAGEFREETFKLENTSSLSVHYSIQLDSQSLTRHADAQIIPAFIAHRAKFKTLVGTQNNSGQQAFDCVPIEGVLPPGGAREVTVTFAPDHASDYFSDGVRIELFGQEEHHVFRVKGVAKDHIMYMGGGDTLTPGVESLAAVPVDDVTEDDKPTTPLLVTLRSVAMDTDLVTATRDIFVGCVRTMAVSQKKNGEWSFENLNQIANLGFTVEPPKGLLEAGTTRPITVTWKPPAGFDTSQAMEANVLVTLKGDVTEYVKVMLRGLVVSKMDESWST